MRKPNTNPAQYMRKFRIQENGRIIGVFCRGAGWTTSQAECEEAVRQIRVRGVTAVSRRYLVRNQPIYLLFVEDPMPNGIVSFVLKTVSLFTTPRF